MRIYKRVSALLMAVVLVFCCTACSDKRSKTAKKFDLDKVTTVNVWYDDDVYTGYLNDVAKKFHDANELVTVKPILVDSRDYLENIYNRSVKEDKKDEYDNADVYLLASSDMYKACDLGIAAENDTYSDSYTRENYGDAAINSAVYKDKLYGYPLSFNTAVMVYNKKYVSKPDSFRNIKDFYDSYTVTPDNSSVQIIDTWDVSDPFLNYAFVGNYINVGGASAEDSNDVSIAKEQLEGAVSKFIELKDGYGMSTRNLDQNTCIDLFNQGKLLYTIVETNRLNEIEQSGVDFDVCNIPDLSENFKSKPLSYTTMAVVNPYASELSAAKAVANAISYDYADYLKGDSNRLSCRIDIYKNSKEDNKNIYQTIAGIYSSSSPKAQFVGSNNIYVAYEKMLHNVFGEEEFGYVIEDFEKAVIPEKNNE